ncbi:MAG: hypothetical protein R3F49_07000 [Planctomycetota bacterium]
MSTFLLPTLLASLLWTGGVEDAPVVSRPAAFVELAALVAAPERWLGETLETIVQVRGAAPGAWEGYMSGLSPATHVALDVWADSQLLWDPLEYAAPLGRLYVRPEALLVSACASAFRALDAPVTWAPHTRLAVRVRVAAFTAGRGWLEVLDARPTAEQVPEGTVMHAIRGLQLLNEGAYGLAASELEKALLPPLPGHAKAPLAAAHARAVARQRATAART